MDRRTKLLLSGAAAAAVTTTALRPVDRFGPGAGPAFALGLPTSEMPLHVAAAEAAVALAIILNFYNNHATVDVDKAEDLKG